MRLTACVSIVTWNSIKYLPSCLDGLYGQTFSDFEIIVVDNASRDGTPEFVKQYHPNIKLLQNEKNQGFCIGHNQAIRLSNAEFLLALNPDVVMMPTYMEELINALVKDNKSGIGAGKIFLPVGECNILDGTGLFINKVRRQYLRGHFEKDNGQFESSEYIFGADGAAPLYRREMLEDIKIENEYFDETFFVHKEDLDLSWRAQLYGWKCVYVPTAVAYHDRSFKPSNRDQMSDEVKLHAVKNRYLAIVKNDLPYLFLTDLPSILWYDFKILVYLLLFERSSLRGLTKFVKFLPRAWRKRRLIMARRRVSRKYIRMFFK